MVGITPLPSTPTTDEASCSGAPFAVLFDSDGVIVDSEKISLQSFCQTSEEFIGAPLSDEEIESACGLRDADIAVRLHRVYGVKVDVEAYKARKAELYRQQATNNPIQAFAGVVELLENLRAERIPYALASSGPRWKIDFNMQQAGLSSAFEVIVSGEEVPRGKPEPDVFLEAAARLHVPPDRCVVIEDSINGIRAARAAGMACLAVTNTFGPYQLHQADRIVESLETVQANDLGRLVLDRKLQKLPPNEPLAHAAPKTSLQTLS